MPHDLTANSKRLEGGYLAYLSHGFVPVFRVLFSPPPFLAPSIKIRLFSTANYTADNPSFDFRSLVLMIIVFL